MAEEKTGNYMKSSAIRDSKKSPEQELADSALAAKAFQEIQDNPINLMHAAGTATELAYSAAMARAAKTTPPPTPRPEARAAMPPLPKPELKKRVPPSLPKDAKQNRTAA